MTGRFRVWKRARYMRRYRWLDQDVTLKEFLRSRWTDFILPVAGMIWCSVFAVLVDEFWLRVLLWACFAANVLSAFGPYYTYRRIVAPHMKFRRRLGEINEEYYRRHLAIPDEPGSDAMTVIYVDSERDGEANGS